MHRLFTPAALVEQMAMGLLAVDRMGLVRMVNASAERMLARPRTHLLDIPLRSILPGHAVAVDLVERAQKLAMPCRFRHAQLHPAPGVLLTVSMTAVPLFGDEGTTPVGALLQMEEMGSVERFEEGERLHETLDSLGSLALAVAHEVKNPMAGIRGAAQLLESETHSASGLACTHLIRDEVDRVTRMLDDLLGLADAHPAMEEEINIHEVLDHVMLLVGKPPLPVRDYDPSLPTVRGNRDRLVQLFLNLLKNACEAAEEGGRVVLATRISQQVRLEQGRRSLRVVVEVRDNGPGVPQEMRKRIFLPFVTGKAKGTGLGLAIAQKIVHEHGGLIEVESSPGDTCFRVYLSANR